MSSCRSGVFRRLRLGAVAALSIVLVLTTLLGACGGSEPTAEVLIVTATFTPQSVAQEPTVTLAPTREELPSSTLPSPPPPEPTVTLAPPEDTKASATPEPAGTEAPAPEASATSTPKPKPKAPALNSYFVVYTSYQGPDLQNYSLWGMNGDGSDVFKIEGAGQASEPAFSVDGTQFAFYHWTDGLHIWDLQKSTSSHFLHDGNASFPSWAPNGGRLAYFVAAGQRWIYIVNADGSNNTQLTPGMRPNWSQKGGFIAYDTCENNKCGIFRINPDGGGKRQLTSDAGGGAAVSPDGGKIIYWSRADGDFEIYVLNSDGSGKKQLTKNVGNDALPAWTPDGRYIYYLSDQDGKGWAVMVMNPNGSNPRKVIGANAGTDPARGWEYQRIAVTWNR
jgi:Tol biopolymer transport system component